MRNDFPIHTRPFDYEAAKAGAPVVLECGFPLTIYKWDCNNLDRPIIGIYGTDDRLCAWHHDGSCAMIQHSRLGLVLTPQGYIDGKPVFFGDELHGPGAPGITLRHIVAPHERDFTGWRWPVPPKVYPVTGMRLRDFEDALQRADTQQNLAAHVAGEIANTAIRHFIDNLTTLPSDCALRAKLVEMGWTPPEVQG